MQANFILSASSPDGFPPSKLPEIAFVGRSNVGKSSLLNRIAQARIARTSKTPGRTQLVNFFEVSSPPERFFLADLPGYGFARAPIELRRAWYSLIEAYLERREPLRLVLLLVDARRGVEEEDAEVYEWLRASGREVLVVATKIDKLPKSKQKPSFNAIAAALGVGRDEVLGVSATSQQGLELLRAKILAAIA